MLHERVHAELAVLAEQLEDLQARRVAQPAEVLGEEHAVGGRLREAQARAGDLDQRHGCGHLGWRIPNTEGLGLERVGVRTDRRGAVIVDEHQQTSVPSIYAAGDVTDQPQFVYVAAAGGAAAAHNALGDGEARRLDFSSLPRIIFTAPQIAAGLTEQQAREQGFDVERSLLPLKAIPRALVNGETGGLFKLVAEKDTGRLLGTSIVADGAAEVIQAAVLAINQHMTIDQFTASLAPDLTMADGLKLAAQTFGHDVAKLSCCAA